MIVGRARRRAAPASRDSPEIPNAVSLFGRFVEDARFGTDGIILLPPDAVLRNESSITADGECLGGSIVDHAVAVVGAEPKTVAAQRDDAVLYEAFVAERVLRRLRSHGPRTVRGALRPRAQSVRRRNIGRRPQNRKR